MGNDVFRKTDLPSDNDHETLLEAKARSDEKRIEEAKVDKKGRRPLCLFPGKQETQMKTGLHTIPIGERIRLVEDLWDSIAADQDNLPLTDEQRTELDRRLDAYEADKIEGREAGEVIAEIKQRL